MIQDAHLDDTLYKSTDAAFLLGDNGGYHDGEMHPNDKQMTVGFDGAPSTHHDDSFASGAEDYDGDFFKAVTLITFSMFSTS